MNYETVCPGCKKQHLVEQLPEGGYENFGCDCGLFLEFANLGLSTPEATWVSVEGVEQKATLTPKE